MAIVYIAQKEACGSWKAVFLSMLLGGILLGIFCLFVCLSFCFVCFV